MAGLRKRNVDANEVTVGKSTEARREKGKTWKIGSGSIISFYLSFYQNLIIAKEFLANLRLADIPLLLFNVVKYPFTVGYVHKNHNYKTLTPDAVKCFVVVCVLTYATRMYGIAEPKWVCWDETHFGKFANHYLNRTFFLDVHPPLAKMSIALVGHLTGYNGTHGFEKPGHEYGDHNYVGMRTYCAIMGGLCVPLAFLTVWELTQSLPATIMSTSFILFDTGCTTLSRYIILDPILIFFIMCSIFCWVKFRSWADCPFSGPWWSWMVATGVSLGCAFSSKWVGLFVILYIGLSTIEDLWAFLGDTSLSIMDLSKHLCARVVGLIAVPVSVYIFFFAIHFHRLTLAGSGDWLFSSFFQSGLIGNKLYNAGLADVAYGSIVRLRNQDTVGGGVYLHSHGHTYPEEHPATQQQITGYARADDNNRWRIHKNDSIVDDTSPVEFLRDGDLVRLMHIQTGRNLHSHHLKAPLSEYAKQVTGYGNQGEGDPNDQWRVQILNSAEDGGRIKTIRTQFRLIHYFSGCALGVTGQKLPKWGFEQMEVACIDDSFKGLRKNTIWSAETSIHRQVPNTKYRLTGPGFWAKLYESHVVMLEQNNGMVDKKNIQSRPWMWPINYRGQLFSGADFRVYLLGNPIIWWGVLVVYLGYASYYLAYEISKKRQYEIKEETREKSELVVKTCGWLFMGWALHYFPFFVMGRVLYYHHYFPSFMISSMLSGILLEHLLSLGSSIFSDEEIRKKSYNAGVGALLVISAGSFYAFRGLTYGMSGPLSNHPNSTVAFYKWLDTWQHI